MMALIPRGPVAEPEVDSLVTDTVGGAGGQNAVRDDSKALRSRDLGAKALEVTRTSTYTTKQQTITSTITILPDPNAPPAEARPVTLTTTMTLPVSGTSATTPASSTNTGTPSNYSPTSSKTSTPTSRETSSPSATAAGGTISPAEAGGIAVGAAVGGVLLALLAVFAYIRLKRKRGNRKGSFSSAAEENKTVHRDVTFLDHLPQAISDETFRQKLRKLSTDIKNCVDNFFSEEHALLDASTEATLQSLAGPPIDGSSWSAAFLNDKTRSCAIRLLIAQIIFNAMHPRHCTDICLLPQELLAVHRIFQKAPETTRREGGFGSDTPSRKELLTLWRQISSHLFPSGLRIKQNHSEAVKIASALAPLHPKPYDSFYRVIEGLVQDAGQLGLELFSDAHEWEPTWEKSPKDVKGAMVVFPGLQVSRKRTVGEQRHGDMEVKVTLTSCIVEY